ncbi:MAG: nickel-dependent hydrogenase large subunit [Candidatus Sifarchaeia archaeon]
MSKSLADKEINVLKKKLKSGITTAKFFLNLVQDIFEKIDDALNMFDLQSPLYMGLQKDGIYSLYDGSLKIADERETLATFDVNDYDEFIIDNRINASNFTPSRTLKKELNLLVGPLARYHIINEYGVYEVHEILKDFQKWDKSILFSNALRLIEVLVCLYKGLLILDNKELAKEQPVFSTYSKIKSENAYSAVEAPRGTLLHNYKVNENLVVEDARIYVPTELNSLSIHEILNRTCKEEFTKNKSLETVQEIAKIVLRSFDPCISCTSVNHHKANQL